MALIVVCNNLGEFIIVFYSERSKEPKDKHLFIFREWKNNECRKLFYSYNKFTQNLISNPNQRRPKYQIFSSGSASKNRDNINIKNWSKTLFPECLKYLANLIQPRFYNWFRNLFYLGRVRELFLLYVKSSFAIEISFEKSWESFLYSRFYSRLLNKIGTKNYKFRSTIPHLSN